MSQLLARRAIVAHVVTDRHLQQRNPMPKPSLRCIGTFRLAATAPALALLLITAAPPLLAQRAANSALTAARRAGE